MATINHLNVSFKRDKIDALYDFFVVTTSEKYIPSGAYILDKPIEKLKAESVVFDNGRTMFVMFKKGMISRLELIKTIVDEKISLKQICSCEIKDYILFRLFLYSIGNYECEGLKYNNVTGKLIIVIPAWINKNRSGFKALNINVDSEFNIVAEAVSFTNVSLFKDKKKISDFPKYTFVNKNNALKRVLNLDEPGDIYIRKSLYGRKAEIPFLNFSVKEINQSKVAFIYKTIDWIRERYEGMIEVSFDSIDISDKIIDYRDAEFMEKAFEDFNSKETNVVSFVRESEFEDDFYTLLEKLKEKTSSTIIVSDKFKQQDNNICYIHNKEYYKDNKYEDPYKKIERINTIQCVTVEDGADKIIKDSDAVFNSIIKETVIKNDILFEHHFSLDNWSDFKFTTDWIFGKEKEGKHYFVVVKPNGDFYFRKKINDFLSFENDQLDKCSNYLTANSGKEKTVVSDGDQNIIVITRTNKMTLPSKETLSLETISRSKSSRDKYLSGVVDINLFNLDDGNYYYNAGIKGAGMNTAIPKASLLYKVEVIQGKNIMPMILKTMSVSFVRYKSFTVLPYPIKYLNEYIKMNN